MTFKISFITATIGAALVFAAPAAWADSWGADESDAAGGHVTPGLVDREVAVSPVRPDNRAGVLGVGAVTMLEQATARSLGATAVRPDDRAGMHGPGAIIAAPLPGPTTSSAESSFQWNDAALGAGAMLGLLVLLGAVGLTIRHRGRVILS